MTRAFIVLLALTTEWSPAAASGGEDSRAVDLAMFAEVVTSDPARAEGTQAGRLHDFPAGDVFLARPVVAGEDGAYVVPVWPDGRSVIGLRWAERRIPRKLILRLAAGAAAASAEQVVVQYWASGGQDDSWGGIGQTWWQGHWAKLPGKLEVQGTTLVYAVDIARIPEVQKAYAPIVAGTYRVRWVFPKTDRPIVVRELSAFGGSAWREGEFRVECQGQVATSPVKISLYNGRFVGSGQHVLPELERTWQTPEPLVLKLRYSEPAESKADRTLLRFESPRAAFTVAVEDVLAEGAVYVEHAGVLVSRAESAMTLLAYRQKTAERRTVLQQVHEMPDQTFGQAMAKLWRPVQNNGPTMLSLACDNRKFIVQRDGRVLFGRTKNRRGAWSPQIEQAGQFSLDFTAAQTGPLRIQWGEIGIDTTVRPKGGKGLPLRIAGKTYAKGIGLHANAELAVHLRGFYETFEALVGAGQEGGSVVFQVEVDGRKRFDSGVMRYEDAPKPIKVSLAGAGSLVLRVSDAGDGISCDAANWAEARLSRASPDDSSADVYLSDLYARDYQEDSSRARRLEKRWLPVLVNTRNEGELILRQRTFVVPYEQRVRSQEPPSPRKALCVVELTIENPTSRSVEAYVGGVFQDVEEPGAIELQAVGNRVLATKKASLLACLDTQGLDPLDVKTCPGMLALRGELPAKTTRRCVVYIPAWDMKPAEHGTLNGGAELCAEAEKYWNELMSRAMQVELPEPLLVDVIRATQVHCMMAARNNKQGRHIEPWAGADRYGPLDTEAQPVILGMGLFGHDWFARGGHEFFLASTNEQGKLVKGYTVMGTGQHLWTLVEHYRLTRDREWLRRAAPTLVRSCRWIIQQTEKTKRLDPEGEKVPEYGLMPPGVLADWHRYAYYFYANGHCCAGVKAVAEALADINHSEAEKLEKAAAEYRENLLRAFRWQQARMPVEPLRDGSSVPPTPSSLYCFGLTREFFSGVSAFGHDVEVGGNHLLPLGILDPRGHQAQWIADFYEDQFFLATGLGGEYPAEENENDWFTRGGFAKLQPHYARTSDIHALRDDVKAFVRTFFNTFPVLLNKENLSYWEHMRNRGGWNKTHESSWFLQMTRTMLVQERGNELWLAPFVTNSWLKDGMTVAVRNAPTHFGPVSYRVQSSAAAGAIEAVIEPPRDNQPSRLVLRLRHPEGKPIRNVTVNGRRHRDFDPLREAITLLPSAEGKITVRAAY